MRPMADGAGAFGDGSGPRLDIETLASEAETTVERIRQLVYRWKPRPPTPTS